MAAFSQELWKNALSSVCVQFEIEDLFPEQLKAVKGFFESPSHLYVSLVTGAGKSLIF